MKLPDILFIIAGTLWAIELLPQLYKTFKTKKVKDISIFYPLICLIAFIFFIIGCFLAEQWTILLAHIFPFINLLIFISFILLYRRKKPKRK